MFTHLFMTITIVSSVVNVLSSAKDTKEIVLWEGVVLPNGPGPKGPERVSKDGSYSDISRPRLIVHNPEHPTGTAVLVIGGGGYTLIEIGNESRPVAKWLQSIGITAFELLYRLPSEGWSPSEDVPFQDGQRAMRLIRSMAGQFGLNANKIGIMGFSAGGHLAGFTETEYNNQLYAPVDSVDRLSARPNFAALLYPVITMLPPYNNTRSQKQLIGKNPDRKQEEKYSVQLHVTNKTPPTFLAQALDDPISNVENSKLMYRALQKVNVITELHLFESGGHGWGLGKNGTPEQAWPKLFAQWAQENGFL